MHISFNANGLLEEPTRDFASRESTSISPTTYKAKLSHQIFKMKPGRINLNLIHGWPRNLRAGLISTDSGDKLVSLSLSRIAMDFSKKRENEKHEKREKTSLYLCATISELSLSSALFASDRNPRLSCGVYSCRHRTYLENVQEKFSERDKNASI